MKREQKYKDTATFHFHNENPKGKFTTDCVIRAIALATGYQYNRVVMELAELQCKTGLDAREPRLYGKYLEDIGWVKHKQPRHDDGTKFTGREFCTWLSVNQRKEYGNIIAHIGGHHLVAISPTCCGDGINDRFKVCDTWDSTDGCIGNYWVLAAE